MPSASPSAPVKRGEEPKATPEGNLPLSPLSLPSETEAKKNAKLVPEGNEQLPQPVPLSTLAPAVSDSRPFNAPKATLLTTNAQKPTPLNAPPTEPLNAPKKPLNAPTKPAPILINAPARPEPLVLNAPAAPVKTNATPSFSSVKTNFRSLFSPNFRVSEAPMAMSTPTLRPNAPNNRLIDGPGMRMIENLPNFSGGPGQRFDDWISKFERICTFTDWTAGDMAQILVTKMTDLAYDVIQDVLEQDVRTYSDLKDKLIERFHGNETTEYYQEKFDKCVRKTGETIPNFAFRLKKLFKRAFPVEEPVSDDVQKQNDALLRRQFLKGLDPSLRAKVRYKTLETFQELVTETNIQDIRKQQEDEEKDRHQFINAVTPNANIQVEQLLTLLKNQSISAVPSKQSGERPAQKTLPPEGASAEKEQKPRKPGPYRRKPFRKNVNRKKHEGNCGYCGKYGHKAEDCFIRKRHQGENQNDKPSLKCYTCKADGHCALRCPNKQSKPGKNNNPAENE